MTPRMKSSKKWTAFPKEYAEQIEVVFKENFSNHLTDSTLVVEGRIYPHEVILRVGLRRNGQLKQANFEASMEYSTEEKDALDRIHNCVDATASMMLEYVEGDGEVDFPLIWQEFPFQDKKIYLKYTTENSDLEAEANKLLGIDTSLVVEEEEEIEELEEQAEAELEDELTADSTDNPEDTGPRMFGGPLKSSKKKKDDLH